MRLAAFAALCIVAIACQPTAGAADLSRPLVLAATEALRHPLYAGTVIVAAPLGVSRHVGFILNRPTELTLAKLFPRHAPSREVTDPVFFGGPVGTNAIFALVGRDDSPGAEALEIAPGLFAVFDAATVDEVIEANPDEARFLAGLVLWQPGELAREIEAGAWHMLDCERALVMRDPAGLWEDLVRRSRRAAGLLQAAERAAHRFSWTQALKAFLSTRAAP